MKTAEKFWDSVAGKFDKSEKRFEEIHIKTIEKTMKYLQSDHMVLDYGCATGTKTFALGKTVKKILGIDISSKMIAFAQQNAEKQYIDNVDFMHAHIFDERLAPNTFDVILAFNVLHVIENPVKALQRIRELLKPGGTFISTTVCMNEKMRWKNRMELQLYLLAGYFGIIPNILSHFSFSDVTKLIATHNFHIMEMEPVYFHISGSFIAAKKV